MLQEQAYVQMPQHIRGKQVCFFHSIKKLNNERLQAMLSAYTEIAYTPRHTFTYTSSYTHHKNSMSSEISCTAVSTNHVHSHAYTMEAHLHRADASTQSSLAAPSV